MQREERVRDAVGVEHRERPGGAQRLREPADRLGGQRMGERLVEDVAALARVEGLDIQHRGFLDLEAKPAAHLVRGCLRVVQRRGRPGLEPAPESRMRPSCVSPSRNSPIRRDRPGSGATSTGAAVAAASDTMETLSIVTTIASASASRPKYGFSPVPSHSQAPSGSSTRRNAAMAAGIGAAGRGEREPDAVLAHHGGELARQRLRHRAVEPEAAVGAAHQHGDQRAGQVGEARSPRPRAPRRAARA